MGREPYFTNVATDRQSARASLDVTSDMSCSDDASLGDTFSSSHHTVLGAVSHPISTTTMVVQLVATVTSKLGVVGAAVTTAVAVRPASREGGRFVADRRSHQQMVPRPIAFALALS